LFCNGGAFAEGNRIHDLDRRGLRGKTFHDINFVDIHYKPSTLRAGPLPIADCPTSSLRQP
jgi:hypothetical protein